MSKRATWIALLDAAQDQPRPTVALRRAVEEVLKRDPVVHHYPDETPEQEPVLDAVDARMEGLAARRLARQRRAEAVLRRPNASERFLSNLAKIQAEDDS